MNIIFWGTPSYSVPALNRIKEEGHNILAVVTQPDKKRGRGKTLLPSAVKYRANEMNLRVLTPSNVKQDKSFIEAIKILNADIFIVVAFGQILSKEILSLPRYGCWNSHCSLLPRWRGAAPIQWSILSGDKETGVAIMLMEEGLDTGPLLIEERTQIGNTENAHNLSCRLSIISANLVVKAISMLSNHRSDINNNFKELKLKSQSETGLKLTYARMINKRDNQIVWENSTIEIYRKILGLYPNAFTFLNKKRIKILSAKLISYNRLSEKDITHQKPGSILSITKQLGIAVKTIDSILLITKLQIEGKKEISGIRLIQTFQNSCGQFFESQ